MKLLTNIIFIIAFLLLTAVGKTAKGFSNYSFLQQVPQQKQGLKQNDTAKNGDVKKIVYKADDSIRTDKKTGIMYLYGNARVIYEDFELDADYIRYNSKENTIFASGVKSKNGRYVGRPIFKMSNQPSSIADSISFNTESRKGIVHNVFTEQEGGYFSGGQGKVQPDQEVHIKGQTFSTCNLPHPHFGIYISKGIATENQIITGPVYLKIEDIPIPPFFLPFAFFPKPNKKSSGFILPTPNQDATRGFSLNGGGYYLAFNDYMDGRLTGNIFTNGSYDLTFVSNYIKKYKYTGNINLNFSSTRNGLEGTPQYKPLKNFNIAWTHSQNPQARPGTTFTASVNAGTSDYFDVTAANQSYDINKIASNTMSSSIAYGKTFGNGLFNFTGSLNHSQETRAKTITLTLPQISLNMATINPFDSKTKVGKQAWYQKITVGYSLQASNTVSTQENLLFEKGGLRRFRNGLNHNIPVSMAFNLFKYFNFNANAGYNEKWYFQTVEKRLIKSLTGGDITLTDTVDGFKRAGEYNVGMNMSTKFYATKQFKNLGRILAIRHVMTPTFNFNYKPDFSKYSYGYYKRLEYYTNDIRPGKSTPTGEYPKPDYLGREQKYSIFDGAAYGGPSMGQQANLSFSIDNNVELKVKSKKDTTNAGEKKIPIIQGLSIGGSYNFAEPTKKKLSLLTFSGRSQFTDKLGFNFGGTFNPYSVDDVEVTTGTSTNIVKTINYQESDRYTWKEGKLPRLTSFTFSFDYSLNPAALKKKNESMDQLRNQNSAARTPEQMEELAAISRDPNAFVDFNIPWNFAFSYSFSYSNPFSRPSTRTVSNTLNFNGDFNLTPKWKIQFNSGYDFKAKDLSYTSFAIYRDLHCWDLNASWIPLGAYQSYSVTIRVKAAILQDLKLSKRKGYYTRY